VPDAPAATDVLEHEVRVAASPETVFSYFTDPVKFVEWMGMDATLDPRPGGVCRLTMNPAASVAGEFVEVEPYSRIVFTWGWEQEFLLTPPASTAVEVSFTPDGDETVVRLVHRRLTPKTVDFHRVGWDHYLDRLALRAGGGDPGPDPWRDVAAAVAANRDVMPQPDQP